MSARRLRLAILVSLCVVSGGALWSNMPADAAIVHDYLSQITEVPAQGPLGEPVQFSGPLEIFRSLTVDAGDLYMGEGLLNGGSRVDVFDSSGGFLSQPIAMSHAEREQTEVGTYGVAVGHIGGKAVLYAGAIESESTKEGQVDVFDVSGKLLAKWTGEDTLAGSFGRLGVAGVAVDSTSGDVIVADAERHVVYVFKPGPVGEEKELVAEITGPEPGVPFTYPAKVVVDGANGDVVVADSRGHGVVDVFEPIGLKEYGLAKELTGSASGEFGSVADVAVDSGNGDIYVLDRMFARVDEFSLAGQYLGQTSGTLIGPLVNPQSIAVDPTTHHLYVGDTNVAIDVFGGDLVVPDVALLPASPPQPRSVTLHGSVNPDEAGPATCEFEWGTSTFYGHTASCTPTQLEGGSFVEVEASLSNLQPDTTYYYRLAASNAHGTNTGPNTGHAAEDEGQVTTLGPGLQEESASNVSATSATLDAQIVPHGATTTYYFQYGTADCETSPSSCTSLPDPPAAIGSGNSPVGESVHLQGLAPSTTYHYRIVVVNEVTTVEGVDATFTTQSTGSAFVLPDGRSWEMVSPPNKEGALIEPMLREGSTIQAAEDGGGISYVANAPMASKVASSQGPSLAQILATRGAAGWSSEDIATPADKAIGVTVSHGGEYRMFSPDLSLAFVEPGLGNSAPDGETPLVPSEAGERTLYVRDNASGGYVPLIKTANVSHGVRYGTGKLEFEEATPDLHHVIFQSAVQLTEEPAIENTNNLYEWSDGHLVLVSVLPNGAPAAGALLGDNGENGQTRHTLSNDGARVVWSVGGRDLYLRDTVSDETVRLNAPRPGAQDGGGNAVFQTASTDGSKVFFTDSSRLTDNSTATRAGEGDLYVFEVTSRKPLAGKLTDLTVDSPLEGAAVQGLVIGASDDGSFVYYVANGALASGSIKGHCGQHNPAGTCGLYTRHYDAASESWEAPILITELSSQDSPDWSAENEFEGRNQDLAYLTSRVSPNGRYLAFMSNRSLTGYNTADASSGSRDEEVYLYDAGSRRLVCASCNPSGARPSGVFETNAAIANLLVDRVGVWPGRWLGASIPGWTQLDRLHAQYQSRYLSNDGRLFFDSADALVPQDTNGREDVYQYEPSGEGDCAGTNPTFSAHVEGCVGLISSGTSIEESAFLDASASGGDVFFLTTSKLLTRDYDKSFDVYDAHACSGVAPCYAPAPVLPPECTTGDSCKAAPSPQPGIFGAAASATFSGAGNVTASGSGPATQRSLTRARKLAKALVACQKRPKSKRAECRRRARKRYGASSKARRSRFNTSLSAGARG